MLFFAGHHWTTGAGPSGLILASAPGVCGWVTPFCPFFAKTGGYRWDFLAIYFCSSSTSILRVYMSRSTGVYFTSTCFIRRGSTFVAEREAVYPLPPRATKFRPISSLPVASQDTEGRCWEGVQRQWDSEKLDFGRGLATLTGTECAQRVATNAPNAES